MKAFTKLPICKGRSMLSLHRQGCERALLCLHRKIKEKSSGEGLLLDARFDIGISLTVGGLSRFPQDVFPVFNTIMQMQAYNNCSAYLGH